MSINSIDSPEHQKHADGLSEALRDRQLTYPYHYDPNPYMRRTRDPLSYAPYPDEPDQTYPYTFLEKALGWAVLALFMLIVATSRVYDIGEVVGH
jgi:hypothetical protein